MDVRVRWLRLRSSTPTTLLELPVCLCVIAAMVGVAVHGMNRIEHQRQVIQAMFLAPAPELAMMEYRAEHGAWPASNESAAYSPPLLGKWSPRIDEAIREGAVDYRFSDRTTHVAGKVLTIRAWQAGASDLPVAWTCGRARAWPLMAASDDRTTIQDDELPSPCRERP